MGISSGEGISMSWGEDTLTLGHPSLKHTALSVAVYTKRSLLPDKLQGIVGNMARLCC